MSHGYFSSCNPCVPSLHLSSYTWNWQMLGQVFQDGLVSGCSVRTDKETKEVTPSFLRGWLHSGHCCSLIHKVWDGLCSS